jgi:hypothetical protein
MCKKARKKHTKKHKIIPSSLLPCSYRHFSESNKPLASGKHTRHPIIDLTKPNEATALALEVIKHGGQANKLLATTPAIRTVIKLLLMNRGLEVFVQIDDCRKLAAADETHVVVSVEGALSRNKLGIPLQLLHRDDPLGVSCPDTVVDGVAIQVRRFRTGAGLEMMRDAACARKAALAEGTGNGGALVDAGVEMLDITSQSAPYFPARGGGTNHPEIVVVLEAALTLVAVVAAVPGNVHVPVTCVLRGEGRRARLALVGGLPVVELVHVLITRALGGEGPRTRLAFVAVGVGGAVVEVLLEPALGGEEAVARVAPGHDCDYERRKVGMLGGRWSSVESFGS